MKPTSKGRFLFQMGRIIVIVISVLATVFILGACARPAITPPQEPIPTPVPSPEPTPTPTPTPVEEIDPIIEELQKIVVLCNSPDSGLDPTSRDSLIDKITNAETAYLSQKPCAPIEFLDAYLDEVQTLRDPDNPIFEQLYNLGRMSIFNMIVGENWECSDHPRVVSDAEAEQQEQMRLTSSTNLSFTANILFAEPRLQTVETQGEAFTEIKIPGLAMRSGDAGLPGIPSIRRLAAIPRGGGIVVSVVPSTIETFKANVYPYQPEPVDQREEDDDDEPPSSRVFADQPFTLDDTVYTTDAFYPEEIYNVTPLGQIRGLEVVQLEVFCGQYNPVTEELRLFDEVLVETSFSPDPETGSLNFLTETSFSPFESDPGLYIGAVINSEAVEPLPPAIPQLPSQLVPSNAGEEFLILTHPDFRQAANKLAAWKNEKGILTSVYEVGTGVTGRETNIEILNFIRNHHDLSIVKPSYLLLFGDAEYIEPWYIPHLGKEGKTIGTDWLYAREPGTGEIVVTLPRYAIGRIPIDSLSQANTVVDKIINYEKNPPSTPGSIEYFYDTVTFASQFQCCRQEVTPGTDQRTFIEVSEWARAHLVNRGYTVQRIYTRTIDYGDPNADPPVAPYVDDPTPRFYYDGDALPSDIGPNSDFAWDGYTQDIVKAWNQGRFLIVHRDHGYSQGFIHPSFEKSDARNYLTNGSLLPVVFSINCSSGIFDNETTDDFPNVTRYFAEQLLQMEGGAVGVLGTTRYSPSWANSVMTMGFFDAIWPGMVSNFGDAKSRRRLGDIMNHAKLYLLTQVGVTGAGVSETTALNQLALWHVIGDPTLEIWTGNPNPLPDDFTLKQEEDSATLDYAIEEAVITVYQIDPANNEFVPIGRAVVEDGQAIIDYFQRPISDAELILTVSAQNAVSRRLTPRPATLTFEETPSSSSP